MFIEADSVKEALSITGIPEENVYVAVYGTLRRECGAAALMEGLTFKAEARIGGLYMYDTGGFPFVTTDSTYHAQAPRVEMFTLPVEGREDHLARLDRYEGVPHLYERKYIDFFMGDRMSLVIIYVWAQDIDFDRHIPVLSGDWVYYLNHRKEEREKAEEQRSGNMATGRLLGRDGPQRLYGPRGRPVRHNVHTEWRPMEDIDDNPPEEIED